MDSDPFFELLDECDSSPEGKKEKPKRKYVSSIRVKRDASVLKEEQKVRQRGIRQQMKHLCQKLAASVPTVEPNEPTKNILTKAIEHIQHLHSLVDNLQSKVKTLELQLSGDITLPSSLVVPQKAEIETEILSKKGTFILPSRTEPLPGPIPKYTAPLLTSMENQEGACSFIQSSGEDPWASLQPPSPDFLFINTSKPTERDLEELIDWGEMSQSPPTTPVKIPRLITNVDVRTPFDEMEHQSVELDEDSSHNNSTCIFPNELEFHSQPFTPIGPYTASLKQSPFIPFVQIKTESFVNQREGFMINTSPVKLESQVGKPSKVSDINSLLGKMHFPQAVPQPTKQT